MAANLKIINKDRDYTHRKQLAYFATGATPFDPKPQIEIDCGYCLDAVTTMPAGGCEGMYRTGAGVIEAYFHRD